MAILTILKCITMFHETSFGTVQIYEFWKKFIPIYFLEKIKSSPFNLMKSCILISHHKRNYTK